MSFTYTPQLNLADRLATFRGYWDENEAAARQLAAVGHVCDRPPIEAIEEGSHCIMCDAFVRKEDSIKALEGPLLSAASDESTLRLPTLHHPNCQHIQVKIPLDSATTLSGSLSGVRVNEIRKFWESRSKPQAACPQSQPQRQMSSLFSLPTELRLQIYSLILPVMEKETVIVPLHQNSARVITQMGFYKTTPRDMTKTNLLSTCHAVHEEALDILFSNTTFKFVSTKVLYLFLRHIGARGRQLLKSVDVRCGSRDDAIAFALLGSCPKLRSITIRLNRWFLMGAQKPLWTVDGMAALLELSGLQTVRFEKTNMPQSLDDRSTDAAFVRCQLTRPRNEPSTVRWVNGHPDL